MKNKEIWKEIPGFDGKYKASNSGKILRVRYKYLNKGTEVERPESIRAVVYTGSNGYGRIVIFKKSYLIHRLIAETFIPNTQNKPFVNHKNGIKADNRVVNLEWCTSSENSSHAYKKGLRVAHPSIGEKHGMTKLTNEDVLAIREQYERGLKKRGVLVLAIREKQKRNSFIG